MSAVCSRNGGAVLFAAARGVLLGQPERWGWLEAMQRDMDQIAAGPSTPHRTHERGVLDAWAADARTLSARARVLRRGAR